MKLSKLALAIGLQAFSLAGCYVVPVGDNNYALHIPSHPAALPPHLTPPPSQPQPRVLHARKGIASAYGAKYNVHIGN